MSYGFQSGNVRTKPNTAELRCFVCPGRSVCLEWHRRLSLRLEYEEVLGALDCLDDLLDQPAWRFALGRQYVCAFHDGNDSFYLVCSDYVVLRLSAEEARLLRSELTRARASVDGEADPTCSLPSEREKIRRVQT